MPLPRLIASCLLLVTTVSAQKGFTCPILGKQWPAPTNISTEPLLLAAAKNLTSQINQLVHGDGPNWNTTSFSITVFSASEDSFAYEYHRTDPTVLHSKAGVRNVTADSVYRIGSVSKLMSVYLFLIQLGGKYLHTPVSHFIPQLLAHANSSLGDLDVIRPNWRDITVTDLASYLAGIPNDFAYDFSIPNPAANTASLLNATLGVFPPIPKFDVPSCGFQEGNDFVACSNEELIQNARQLQPIFANGYTPIYSNIGYALLGVFLEKAANKTMSQIFDDQLVRRLGLSNAKFDAPFESCKGVIPVNESVTGWVPQYGAYGAAASNFASSEDMAKIGRSMLRNSLISPSLTRRWLKPTSFLEDFSQGVGLAWEIFRVKVDDHSVAIFSKGGDVGVYHTSFAIIPDYNVGISVMTAIDPATDGIRVKVDGAGIVASVILPAVAQIAKQQATRNFAARYVTHDGTNSSLTLTTDDLPGLKLQSWIVNGTNLFDLFFTKDGKPTSDVRLLPNELYPTSSGKVGFTGTELPFIEPAANIVANGSFTDLYSLCREYEAQSNYMYGGVDVTELVFNVNAQGKALSFRHLALRKTFYRAT